MFQGLYDGLPSLPGEQPPQAPTDATAVSSTKSVDGTSKVADESSAQPIPGEKKAVWAAMAQNLARKRAALQTELSKKKRLKVESVSEHPIAFASDSSGISTTITKKVKIGEQTNAQKDTELRNSVEYKEAFIKLFGSTMPLYDVSSPLTYSALKKEKMERERMEREMEKEKEKEKERKERIEKGLNISGEEAFRRRQLLSAQFDSNQNQTKSNKEMLSQNSVSEKKLNEEDDDDDIDGVPITNNDNSNVNTQKKPLPKMSPAEHMMALMGWRAGRGLGRGEQGIRAPLIHKRLDRTTGIIVEAEQKQWEEQKKEQVIVLLNMVLPGMVDAELEGEVKSECLKFGFVEKVSIFENRNGVRVFVKFNNSDAATNAIHGLNGRHFGGRTVIAKLYDQNAFENGKLDRPL